jgi:LysM repeat protein
MTTPTQESSGESSTASQSGNIFLRKIGPMPLWGWMGVILGVVLVYYFWRQNKAKDKNNNNSNAGSSTEQGSSSANDIPQFVNQTYTTVLPPSINLSQTQNNNEDEDDDDDDKKPGGGHKPGGNGNGHGHKAPHYTVYTVKHGDTLSGIAKKYGTTWQTLFNYNTRSKAQGGAGRPANTIKTLKERGPNLLYAGEKIYIPTKEK